MPWFSMTIGVVGIALGVAAFVFGAMRLPEVPRVFAYVLLTGMICAMPLVIPSDDAWIRFAFCIPIAGIVFKMWDLHASARVIAPGDSPDPRDPGAGLAFLIAPPTLMLFRRWRRAWPVEDRASLTEAVPCLVRAAVAGAGLWIAFRRVDWLAYPFWLEYVVKVSLVFVVVPGVTNAMIVFDRWRGLPVVPVFDRIWSSATPAEFWRRFDTLFHHFCREHVWIAWGGRRHPRLATLAIFAFSAVGHELLFTIALGRVEGYQLAFFTLNGIVVAATLGWRPQATLARVLSTGATLAFVLASGTLFFASVQSVMGFFVER